MIVIRVKHVNIYIPVKKAVRNLNFAFDGQIFDDLTIMLFNKSSTCNRFGRVSD